MAGGHQWPCSVKRRASRLGLRARESSHGAVADACALERIGRGTQACPPDAEIPAFSPISAGALQWRRPACGHGLIDLTRSCWRGSAGFTRRQRRRPTAHVCAVDRDAARRARQGDLRAVALDHGVSRTAVERRIKQLAVQVAATAGIEGLNADGATFVRRLRLYRDRDPGAIDWLSEIHPAPQRSVRIPSDEKSPLARCAFAGGASSRWGPGAVPGAAGHGRTSAGDRSPGCATTCRPTAGCATTRVPGRVHHHGTVSPAFLPQQTTDPGAGRLPRRARGVRRC